MVVPTGFITAQSGIEKSIRKHLVDKKMLAGVVSMPSNIFATTGTNVSILFIDRSNKEGVVLIDASNLGTKIKDGKNQKTVLSDKEEQRIISAFNGKQPEEDFSVVVNYDEIAKKNYSLSAGQYFDVKIKYVDLTPAEFDAKMDAFNSTVETDIVLQSAKLEKAFRSNWRVSVMNKLTPHKFDDLYEMASGISSKPEQAGHGSPFLSFSTVFNNYFLPDVLTDRMDTSKRNRTNTPSKREIYSSPERAKSLTSLE